MLTEKRVPLSAFLKGAEGLEPADGVVVLVRWWRAMWLRLIAWLWPAGVVVASGIALLLIRANAFDRAGMNLALAALTLLTIWLFVVVYPRTLPTRGHQRVCWVVVGRETLHLPGPMQAAAQRKPVLTLVVLAGGRGLALVGDTVVELREASMTVEIMCSTQGRVASARIGHTARSNELRAYGRVPRKLRRAPSGPVSARLS